MNLAQQHIADIPAYIFGQSSELCTTVAPAQSLAEGAQISFLLVAMVIMLGSIYLLWLNYWGVSGNNHLSLLRFLGFHRGDYEAKIEALSPSFSHYVNSAAWVSFVAIWIVATVALGVNSILYIKFCLGIFLFIVAVYAFQMVVIRLLGLVMGDKPFSHMILVTKGILYSLLALFITPVALCYSLSNGVAQQVFAYIIGFQVFVVLSIFLYETFLLFLTKKVSLLHTILYLCTVEIFPMTLIWGFFSR